jgi:protein phosphatase
MNQERLNEHEYGEQFVGTTDLRFEAVDVESNLDANSKNGNEKDDINDTKEIWPEPQLKPSSKSSTKLAFNYAVASETGTVRESNQDSAFAGKNFLLVADGMGGHAGGDVASTMTVTMLSMLDNEANPRGLARRRLSDKEAISLIERRVVQVYLAIIEAVKENAELGGMGTTLTAILHTENSFITAHLGDSRAYVLRSGELLQLTTDHTFVQHLVNSGKITEDEAKHHPQKNVVMRVLGDFEVDLNPDFAYQPILKGDRYFLCSDGVCGVLSDEIIKEVLQDTTEPNLAADKLVELALNSGSNDNCTAIVADVVPEKQLKSIAAVPIFAGAAKESLQDYLNEIVQRNKKLDKMSETPILNSKSDQFVDAESKRKLTEHDNNNEPTQSHEKRTILDFFRKRMRNHGDE